MSQMGSLYGVPAPDANVARGYFIFTSPGVLALADNAMFPRMSPDEPVLIDNIAAEIETAPTGAAILADFRKGKRSTGVLATAFATLTIAISAFTASKDIPPMIVYPDEFLTVYLTQVGSTIAGSNATFTARGLRRLR